MEGITILSTNSEMIWTDGTFILIMGLLAIILCIAVVMLCTNTPLAVDIVATIICIICLFSALFFMAFGPTEPHITHKALIDESVSMIEFNQKYTIKDQDGQIYTIVEKDFSK